MACITGKPQSPTALLIDLASARARQCGPGCWDRERLRGICTAQGHRGELELCLSLCYPVTPPHTPSKKPSPCPSFKPTKGDIQPNTWRLNYYCDF